MPQRTPRPGKRLFHLLFLTAALSLLSAVVRRERSKVLSASRARTRKIRVGPRRIAVSLAFATLFFAGAALSAGAGNSVIAAHRLLGRVGGLRRDDDHDHDHDYR